jgi:hypothetical protein
MSVGWDYVSELWSPMDLLFIPKMIHEHGEPWWNAIYKGKANNSREKIYHSATSSTINLHGLTWALTCASNVNGHWLTIWAMARPLPGPVLNLLLKGLISISTFTAISLQAVLCHQHKLWLIFSSYKFIEMSLWCSHISRYHRGTLLYSYSGSDFASLLPGSKAKCYFAILEKVYCGSGAWTDCLWFSFWNLWWQ